MNNSNFGKAEVRAEGEPVFGHDFVPPKQPSKNAYEELMKFLEEGEVIEGIVFGEYGWGGYGEEEDHKVHKDLQGVLMSIEMAKPLMDGWSFNGGYGAPECNATYVWTNKRCIWVTQYDGSTCLDSMPRHPVACMPDMPGG